MLAAAAILCFWLAMLPAQALVVTIDLGWGYNYDGAGTSVDLMTEYNLQVGSIVQVIMYDSSVYGPPGVDADDNFDIIGYNSSDPENLADDNVYDPTTTPDGHMIAYTASIQAAPYADGQGDTGYQIYAQFEVIGTYDSLYIRVFEMTNLAALNGNTTASYWGLSDVQYSTNIVGMWYVPIIDNTDAPNRNYFEVIPEPGTVGLLALGGVGLFAGARRRRTHRGRTGTVSDG